jgi:hypothetical protein
LLLGDQGDDLLAVTGRTDHLHIGEQPEVTRLLLGFGRYAHLLAPLGAHIVADGPDVEAS